MKSIFISMVPSRASEGHSVRRCPHPVAVRRSGPPEEGRDHRQAAVRRLLHHQPGLCRPLRVLQVYDRPLPHRPRRHHDSEAAYKEVEAFLSVYPDYPPLLKNKILQAAYPLYRKYADKEKIN